MKRYSIPIIPIIFLFYTSCNQPIPNDSLYMGQIPPDNTPKVFNLPVDSGMSPGERVAISKDGKNIYYTEYKLQGADTILGSKIKCMYFEDNTWNGPVQLLFDSLCGPSLSISDDTLFAYYSDGRSVKTYYATKNEAGWSAPEVIFPDKGLVYYLQQPNKDNFYLTTFSPELKRVVIAQLSNSPDATVKALPFPVNSSISGWDFFMARDESYIIFVHVLERPNRDLFISFKKDDSTWTNPKSLGPSINTPDWECAVYVSPDEKYLFFVRVYSKAIFWVKIDNIIDSLRHTNFSPYLTPSIISNQTGRVGQLFTYTIPEDAFVDDDGNNTLVYSTTLSNGTDLPSWLSFDAETRTFSGIPSATGSIEVRATVTDTANDTASCEFDIIVQNSI